MSIFTRRAGCAAKATSEVTCWGDDEYGVAEGTHEALTFEGVWTRTDRHAGAITLEGDIACWGEVPPWLPLQWSRR